MIEHLPSHLRHSADTSIYQCEELEQRLPWIATQRISLVVVLLYYRLAINRILQAFWLKARPRSIRFSSAVGLAHSVTPSSLITAIWVYFIVPEMKAFTSAQLDYLYDHGVPISTLQRLSIRDANQ